MVMLVSFWVVGVPVGWILAMEFRLEASGLFASIGLAMFLAFVGNAIRFTQLCRRGAKALL